MKKLIFAILVLISLWCCDLQAVQYFSDDLNMPAPAKPWFVKSTSELLESMKEPPLWSKAEHRNRISYRFIHKQLWEYKDVVIFRVDQAAKKKWVLTVKQTDHFPSKGDFKAIRKHLSKEEVKEFQELFAKIQFWELPSVGALEHEMLWTDYPPIWILEVVQHRRYQLISRVGPKSTSWNSSYHRVFTLKKEEGCRISN